MIELSTFLFKSLNYNLLGIEKTKFYVNITADLLYNERIPMDELVPSFFQKLAFFFNEMMERLANIFNRLDTRDPYDAKWYTTKLDRIVGTWTFEILWYQIKATN